MALCSVAAGAVEGSVLRAEGRGEATTLEKETWGEYLLVDVSESGCEDEDDIVASLVVVKEWMG